MVLFVLHKLILQMRMHSYPVRLDVWCLVEPFIYFHTLCVQTAKALARLRGCACSPEPKLVAYVISTIISWAGSFNVYKTQVENSVTRVTVHYHEACWAMPNIYPEQQNFQFAPVNLYGFFFLHALLSTTVFKLITSLEPKAHWWAL